MTANQIKILLRVEDATIKGKWFQAKTDAEACALGLLRKQGYLVGRSQPLSGLAYQSVVSALAAARCLGLLPERGTVPRKREVHLRGPRP